MNIVNFLKEYDSGDLRFDDLKYRVGAAITCPFGLAEGYRIVDGAAVWDAVRIHSGVDRGRGIVYSPFNFNRSELHNYGPEHVYGSLIRLFNDEWGFEMRIAHMDPSEIPWGVRRKLKKGKAIARNERLGVAGNYGLSFGAHTHTEFVSQDESCPLFETLLQQKFGVRRDKAYTNEEIKSFYRTRPHFATASDKRILDDFEAQKKKRRIVGVVNDYKYVYKDWYYGWEIRTRYSSDKLFNGL